MIRFLIWLDRTVNDKLLRGRWETISSRCFRRAKQGHRFCTWLCKRLGEIDPNHCQKAYTADRVGNPKLPE